VRYDRGVGVWHPKCEENLAATAHLYGAAFVYTVGRRYRKQCSDTMNTPLHIPLFHFADVADLREHLPHGALLVGVELDERARPLLRYGHPLCATYLLGAEDHGLPADIRQQCHSIVEVESAVPRSMNVSVAGSIVMWHRHTSDAVSVRRAA
jgi:tRNA G18 (ribose-2'-O)-methylase SpoU